MSDLTETSKEFEVKPTDAKEHKQTSKIILPPATTQPAVKKNFKKVGEALTTEKAKPMTQFELEFEDMIRRYLKNGPESTITLINNIQKYVEVMDPKKQMSPVDGAKMQMGLWKTLSNVIEKTSNEEFRKNWVVVLSFFHRYRHGVFSPRYINRYAEEWPSNDDNLKAFQRLVNLIELSSNPNERSMILKRVNIHKTLEVGFSESGRTNLIQFYNA